MSDALPSLEEQIRSQWEVIKRLKSLFDSCEDTKELLRISYQLTIAQSKLSEMQRVLQGVSRRGRVKNVVDVAAQSNP